jgi:hypothetical protein
LKSLSHTCIYSLEADTIISTEQFYKDYFNKLFNNTLLSYINDSTKVSAGYDGSNFLENNPCLSANTGLDNAKLANIHIGIPIPGEEGLTVIIHLIETKSGYKFCGHYTIP